MESSEELFDELKNTEFETEESQKKVGRPKKEVPTKPYHRRCTDEEIKLLDEYLNRVRIDASSDKRNPAVAEAFFLLGKYFGIIYHSVQNEEKQAAIWRNTVGRMHENNWLSPAMQFVTDIMTLKQIHHIEVETQNIEELLAEKFLSFDISKINQKHELISFYFTMGWYLYKKGNLE